MSREREGLPGVLDRIYLRLWWWAEGRALDRMAKRWPVEYRDWKRDDNKPRSDFLTDAYQHLVESPKHPPPAAALPGTGTKGKP